MCIEYKSDTSVLVLLSILFVDYYLYLETLKWLLILLLLIIQILLNC